MNKKYFISVLSALLIVSLVASPFLVQARGNDEHHDRGLHLGNTQLDIPCVKTAISIRDSAVMSALDSFNASIKASFQARHEAVMKAYDTADVKARAELFVAAQASFEKARKSAEETWRKAREDAKKKFKEEAQKCIVAKSTTSTPTTTP